MDNMRKQAILGKQAILSKGEISENQMDEWDIPSTADLQDNKVITSNIEYYSFVHCFFLN